MKTFSLQKKKTKYTNNEQRNRAGKVMKPGKKMKSVAVVYIKAC